MKRKSKPWRKLLTKKQLAHLKWANVPTLGAFRHLRAQQAKQAIHHNSGMEVCWDCRFIEKRLAARLERLP